MFVPVLVIVLIFNLELMMMKKPNFSSSLKRGFRGKTRLRCPPFELPPPRRAGAPGLGSRPVLASDRSPRLPFRSSLSFTSAEPRITGMTAGLIF